MRFTTIGETTSHYKGLMRVGWVGDSPKEALWLVAVNYQGVTEWWWMDSIQAIFELTKFYKEECGFVGDKLPHVAISLTVSPLLPIPVKSS